MVEQGRGNGSGPGSGLGAGAGERRVDHAVRMRLAEVLASAGVDHSRVAVEVLFLLPPEFVRGYEDLFHRALQVGDRARGGGDDQKTVLGKALGKGRGGIGGRTKSSEGEGLVKTKEGELVENRGEVKAAGMALKGKKGKGPGGVFVVADERALGEKDRIDRALRKLARGMRDGGDAGTGRRERCGGDSRGRGCGKWIENEWKYCPYCGKVRVAGG